MHMCNCFGCETARNIRKAAEARQVFFQDASRDRHDVAAANVTPEPGPTSTYDPCIAPMSLVR